MTTIETDIVTLNQSDEAVFNLLKDLNNYKALFPEDRIKNWTSTETSCSFLIKGMSTIEMDVKNLTPNSSVKLKSGGQAPFKFDIDIVIEASKEEANLTAIQLVFNADMNPFVKMMVVKPLTAFFNNLVHSVEKQF